jgi:predicted MFS family arabinose efflux permease
MTVRPKFQWRVALILFGVLFIGVSDTQLIPPLLPLIAREFEKTPGGAGILVTGYAVAAAVFALFAGPVSDRIGRKRVLVGALALFAVASFATYYVHAFTILLATRMLTGLAAGALSTCALSFAADEYVYAERGRAMGIISMAYFMALVVGVPLGAFVAPVFGWRIVFGALSGLALAMLALSASGLPADHRRERTPFSLTQWAGHFRRADRLGAMGAAFLTSGSLGAFMTYVGLWLNSELRIDIQRIGLVFMLAGLAAVIASPLSGWLADRVGKTRVLVIANVVLAVMFVLVARASWGAWLLTGIGVLSIAASARQAPLHALTTELVGTEIRGEFIAVRNAASQLGIAMAASASAVVFDRTGFSGVSALAAVASLLAPVCLVWIRER